MRLARAWLPPSSTDFGWRSAPQDPEELRLTWLQKQSLHVHNLEHHNTDTNRPHARRHFGSAIIHLLRGDHTTHSALPHRIYQPSERQIPRTNKPPNYLFHGHLEMNPHALVDSTLPTNPEFDFSGFNRHVQRRVRTIATYVFGGDQERCGFEKQKGLKKLPDKVIAAMGIFVPKKWVLDHSVEAVRLLCDVATKRLERIIPDNHPAFTAICEEIAQCKSSCIDYLYCR